MRGLSATAELFVNGVFVDKDHSVLRRVRNFIFVFVTTFIPTKISVKQRKLHSLKFTGTLHAWRGRQPAPERCYFRPDMIPDADAGSVLGERY